MSGPNNTPPAADKTFLVVGLPGSGKSTLAIRLASFYMLTYIDLDALKHGIDWSTRDSFATDVERATNAPAWVVDSAAYPQVADLLWARAGTVIFLDLPRYVVLPRLLWRTLRRQLTREVLSHGNRETLCRFFSRQHPVAKVLRDYTSRRTEILARRRVHQGDFVHVRGVREAEILVATMAARMQERAGADGRKTRG